MPGLDEQEKISSTFNANAAVLLRPAQAALDQQMKGTNQFTIIQDSGGTGHNILDKGPQNNSLNSLTFLTDPQTASVLAQNGVKNLAMEIRHEFQPLADKVATGQITPQEFAVGVAEMYKEAGDIPGSKPSARAVEQGKVIQAMAANGIKVLCVEDQASDLKAHGALADERAAISADYEAIGKKEGAAAAMQKIRETNDPNYFNNSPQELVKIMKDAHVAALNDPQNAITAQFYKMNTEQRLNQDAHLAEQIKAKVGDKKTVVYYGQLHGAYEGDLDEKLDGAKKIAIQPDEISIKTSMQSKYSENMQIPGGAIALDSGTSYSQTQLNDFILKDAGRIPQTLTPTLGRP